ncbi:hypothetical protein BO78DRAFT_467979 [Aspergillus sclerotiicarbonarius CBS 121057]|uniref:Uncharacterized protein n=1 Tax=Aspergillus sclerotiicarbonarius (strain CBS 121057 / IBT 28362) TaxID=1448318 RepID=A0A319EQM4_ASPSB|nr:hypothetical protein BO78DRAFT_467979 [Aspergillus sclerotiicarbonarius CBS 121057]
MTPDPSCATPLVTYHHNTPSHTSINIRFSSRCICHQQKLEINFVADGKRYFRSDTMELLRIVLMWVTAQASFERWTSCCAHIDVSAMESRRLPFEQAFTVTQSIAHFVSLVIGLDVTGSVPTVPFARPPTMMLACVICRTSKGMPARGPISKMAGQPRGWETAPRSGWRDLATPMLAVGSRWAGNPTRPD